METGMLPGGSSPANSSSAISQAEASLQTQLTAGALAALLHESFRFGLKLPGDHGLEWFAILVLARLGSSLRGAATVVAGGAIAASMAIGSGHEPQLTRTLTSLLQGGAIDALYLALPALWRSVLAVALAGALVHALAPLFKYALAVSVGTHFGSLVQGLGFPLLTHLLFGGCGALLGVLGYRAARRESWKA